MEFKLKARINRSEVPVIQQALKKLAARGTVKREGDEFLVEAKVEGSGARELNRTLLSSLRKVEKKTTLRAEWTSIENVTDKFFDYVLKKTAQD